MTAALAGARARPDAFARYAEQAVPRYTSYPTVPHFHDGVDAETYRGWLAALDPAAPISLYLHVPFCSRICWYCACNMKLAARYAPLAAYVESLLAEIDLIADALPARMRVAHLHWGGGTPTTLEPDDLERVMDRLAERFLLASDAEIAVEADPRSLSVGMIERLGALGFTRASFGVQEFDADVQAAINRIQPPELVADCVAGLRDAGVSAINFDLVFGLPRQTVASLEKTAALSSDMRADRLALFGYAHVPWMAKNQRMIDAETLPDAAARFEQARRAAAVFEEAGYAAIGVDHFAKPEDPLAIAARSGRLRRNFQGYTTDDAPALLGLGATSIGRTPFGYVQNVAETGAWARAVAEGRPPVAKGVAFEGEDRLRAHVIEQLMCAGDVDLADAGALFGAEDAWWRGETEALRRLEADGVVALSDARLSLTSAGATLRRVVAAVFDRYLAASAARHSRAV